MTAFLFYSILPYLHNDTRTAATSSTSSAWAAWTASTAATGNIDQESHRMAVDGRFQPILLCEGSVDLRGSLRGFGFVDYGIV